MDSYSGGTADNPDEYTSARKLVLRAAKREEALGGAASMASSEIGADFSNMPLKADHIQRPCWTCPDGIIFLEAFHDLYVSAYDFLVAIAEPVARPEFIHQYKLTPYSLYAAVATNIETEAIISVLDRLSKNDLPSTVKKFIRDCTQKVSHSTNCREKLASTKRLTNLVRLLFLFLACPKVW
jgi:hypothetical protein